jgi:hypothetical protein
MHADPFIGDAEENRHATLRRFGSELHGQRPAIELAAKGASLGRIFYPAIEQSLQRF